LKCRSYDLRNRTLLNPSHNFETACRICNQFRRPLIVIRKKDRQGENKGSSFETARCKCVHDLESRYEWL